MATLASLIIAGVWYTNVGFGPTWLKLTKIDQHAAKKAGNAPMVIVLAVNFVTACIMALFIAVAEAYLQSQSLWVALGVALAVWLSFSASTLLTHNIFEQKSYRLTAINSGYQLVIFVVMALIIGVI